jgi:hypothetical protein
MKKRPEAAAFFRDFLSTAEENGSATEEALCVGYKYLAEYELDQNEHASAKNYIRKLSDIASRKEDVEAVAALLEKMEKLLSSLKEGSETTTTTTTSSTDAPKDGDGSTIVVDQSGDGSALDVKEVGGEPNRSRMSRRPRRSRAAGESGDAQETANTQLDVSAVTDDSVEMEL